MGGSSILTDLTWNDSTPHIQQEIVLFQWGKRNLLLQLIDKLARMLTYLCRWETILNHVRENGRHRENALVIQDHPRREGTPKFALLVVTILRIKKKMNLVIRLRPHLQAFLPIQVQSPLYFLLMNLSSKRIIFLQNWIQRRRNREN